MKKVLAGAVASAALAAALFTASAPVTSSEAEAARRCSVSNPCTSGVVGRRRGRSRDSGGIDITTLMLLGGGGLASPMGLAGAGTGGAGILGIIALEALLDRGGRRR